MCLFLLWCSADCCPQIQSLPCPCLGGLIPVGSFLEFMCQLASGSMWSVVSPEGDGRMREMEMPEFNRDLLIKLLGFPDGTHGKEPTCQCRRHKRCGFDP